MRPPHGRGTRAGAGSAFRTVFSAAPLLLVRRLRRDGPILLASILLTAFVFLLAAATPQFIARTADEAARRAVAVAGDASDLTVRVSVATIQPPGASKVVKPEDIEGVADGLLALLPTPLARVHSSTTTTVLSPATDVGAADDGTSAAPNYRVRFGLLTVRAAALLGIPEGDGGTPGSVSAVISAAGASVTALGVGDEFTVTGNSPPPRTSGAPLPSPRVAVRIAAVAPIAPVAAVAPQSEDSDASPADLWADEPTFLTPTAAGGPTEPAEVTVLLTPAGMAELGGSTPLTFEALLRLRFDPSRFTSATMAEFGEATRVLKANNSALVNGTGYPFVVNSDFADIARPYFAQLTAGNAQMALLLAGLLGAGFGAMLLMGQLLALGRGPELALERARGSSFTAIGVRAVIDGSLLTVLGASLGLGCSAALLQDAVGVSFPVVFVAVTSLLIVPVQAVYLAGGLRRRRPLPRDRSERRRLERLTRLRRAALEATVVAAGVAAVVTVRFRGIADEAPDPSGATGIDPLVALGPLVFAVAIGLVVLRVVPVIVVGGAGIARRSRGALGVLGAAGAGRALRENTLLPLGVLVISIGLAASGAFFTASVADGQLDASLQSVGADARVDGPVTQADLEKVLAAPGVDRASRIAFSHGSGLDLGTSIISSTIVAIDPHYGALIGSQPTADDLLEKSRRQSLQQLAALSADPVTSGSESDPIPAVVDSRVAAQLVSDDVIVSIGQRNIHLHVIGEASASLPGLGETPVVYVDLDRLVERLAEPPADGALLIDGVGAGAAAAELSVPGSGTRTRAGWLATQQSLPLVRGVQTLFAASALAFGVLALIALMATALAGSRRRVREVSLLHTMGFTVQVGWWLALSELLPVVVGAIVGGLVAGVGIVLLLGPALHLGSLAGGAAPPALHLPPSVGLVLAGVTLVMLAATVFAEVVVRRRGRLIDVLRVGDTV